MLAWVYYPPLVSSLLPIYIFNPSGRHFQSPIDTRYFRSFQSSFFITNLFSTKAIVFSIFNRFLDYSNRHSQSPIENLNHSDRHSRSSIDNLNHSHRFLDDQWWTHTTFEWHGVPYTRTNLSTACCLVPRRLAQNANKRAKEGGKKKGFFFPWCPVLVLRTRFQSRASLLAQRRRTRGGDRTASIHSSVRHFSSVRTYFSLVICFPYVLIFRSLILICCLFVLICPSIILICRPF